MGIFRKAKAPIIPGKIIKDYGLVNECRKGITKFRYNALLVEQWGKLKLIIRESSTLIGTEIRDFEFDKAGVEHLREALNDALKKM